MGSTFPAINALLIPVILLQLLFNSGHLTHILTYALFSIELFLSAYLLSRLFQLSHSVALFTGWCLNLIVLPFIPQVFFLSTFFQTVPLLIWSMFYTILFLTCFRKLGQKPVKKSILFFLGVMLIPSYLVLAESTTIIIFLPVVFFITLALFVFSKNLYEYISKFFGVLLSALLAFSLKLPEFLYGFTSFTTFKYFSTEFLNGFSYFNQSVLFQYHNTIAGIVLIPLSVLGALLMLTTGQAESRRFAGLYLFLVFFLLGAAIFVETFIDNYQGPQLDFFEIMLWPLYVAYSCYAIAKIFGRLNNKFLCHCSLNTAVTMAMVVFLINFIFNHSKIPTQFPPAKTPITQYLQEKIGLLVPGSVFRGYAATIAPKTTPKQIAGWGVLQAGFSQTLINKIGNDHRTLGLWNFNIPTLVSYSDYSSPLLYLFVSRLLNRSTDAQSKNIIIVTDPNFQLLAAIGVRFIITNELIHHHKLTLIKKLPIDNQNGDLYLYELPHPNIANYSPITFIKTTTAADMISILKKGVDLKKVALVSETLHYSLVPASYSHMFVNKGAVRVVANSQGISAILLPILYDHCLQPQFLEKRPEEFHLLRANLIETLLVFKSKLAVSLSLPRNAWNYGDCQIKNMADAKQLKIVEAANRYPIQQYKIAIKDGYVKFIPKYRVSEKYFGLDSH